MKFELKIQPQLKNEDEIKDNAARIAKLENLINSVKRNHIKNQTDISELMKDIIKQRKGLAKYFEISGEFKKA